MVIGSIEQLRDPSKENRDWALSAFFNRTSKPEEWARALYFYLFFALKKRLRQENVGALGAAWDVLPADSRMPDHCLWHHLGLTSAIGSCMAEDAGHNVALAVFAITPVQAFIGRARKLRDHWVGSVLLSYLAFTGIRHVAETRPYCPGRSRRPSRPGRRSRRAGGRRISRWCGRSAG